MWQCDGAQSFSVYSLSTAPDEGDSIILPKYWAIKLPDLAVQMSPAFSFRPFSNSDRKWPVMFDRDIKNPKQALWLRISRGKNTRITGKQGAREIAQSARSHVTYDSRDL